MPAVGTLSLSDLRGVSKVKQQRLILTSKEGRSVSCFVSYRDGQFDLSSLTIDGHVIPDFSVHRWPNGLEPLRREGFDVCKATDEELADMFSKGVTELAFLVHYRFISDAVGVLKASDE